jgi:hypothetical protein
MFSFTFYQARLLLDINALEMDANTRLGAVLHKFINSLIKAIFSPCRISGMNLFQDFED